MKNAYNFPKTQGDTFQRQRVRTQKMYVKIKIKKRKLAPDNSGHLFSS